MLFAWEEGAELPQSKPDGFASSSGREPLARPQTLRFSRKLYRHAKGPIPEGAVCDQREQTGGVDWGSSGKNPFRLAASRQATLPLLSLRDIFPRPGEVGPQGDGFSGGDKVSGSAIRRPLGGAGCERSEQTEGVLPAAPERVLLPQKATRKLTFQRTYVNKSRISKKCKIF